MKCLQKMPDEYRKEVLKTIEKAKRIFEDNLVNITLCGSGGKGNIIEGWSDLDFYIILENYNKKQVTKFMKSLKNTKIHIGTTFYTIYEIRKNIIDSKTKIALYERQNYDVNPILYGEDIFNKISYETVKNNDLTVLPNILHDFRRRFIELKSTSKEVDKPYIKKMLVLAKCILSHYDIFSYGYIATFRKLDELFIKKGLIINNKYFDVIYVINNIKDSKKYVLNYSELILDYIEKFLLKEDL